MPSLPGHFSRVFRKPRPEKGTSFHTKIAELEDELQATSTNATRAEKIVDELDELMPRIQDEEEKGHCLRVLAEGCRQHVVLPESCKISDVQLVEKRESAVADIWMGKHPQGDICVKVFRQYEVENLHGIQGALYYRAVRWKHISHPNVLPFLGVSGPEIVHPFGLITPWMLGSIREYTKGHEDVNRLLLLKEAACGLEYLHSLDIVHGRIKPWNILITGEGRACIADFGIDDSHGAVHSASATHQQEGIRYMAPEQLENASAGKKSDVYSFAITAYEVLVGVDAYSGTDENKSLGTRIINGVRPVRTEDVTTARWLSNDIWNLLGSCWSPDPSARPTIGECTERFRIPLWRVLLNRIRTRK